MFVPHFLLRCFRMVSCPPSATGAGSHFASIFSLDHAGSCHAFTCIFNVSSAHIYIYIYIYIYSVCVCCLLLLLQITLILTIRSSDEQPRCSFEQRRATTVLMGETVSNVRSIVSNVLIGLMISSCVFHIVNVVKGGSRIQYTQTTT